MQKTVLNNAQNNFVHLFFNVYDFFSTTVDALISHVNITVIVTIEPSKIISEKISYKWGVPSHFRNACVLAKHPDTPTHENMFCATRPQDYCARSHNLWGGGAVVACTGLNSKLPNTMRDSFMRKCIKPC